MIGVLGKKIGMTHIFDEDRKRIPVTLIEADPSLILDIKTKEKNGYNALQIGIGDRKKPSKNAPKKIFIKEIRLKDVPKHKKGDLLGVDVFQAGNYVDVTGTSKGKGFQGGMKRWGWKGGEQGHGSMFHRRVGSIGASSFPSRVHRGKTMPGHMGNVRKTVQSLKILKVDKENNLLVVKGSVPGHNDSYLIIREAKKRITKPLKEKSEDKTQKAQK